MLNSLKCRASVQARVCRGRGVGIERHASVGVPVAVRLDLNVQIAAIDKQIAEQQSRLTGKSGKSLNSTVEEYQRLQMEAGFAEDVYKTALAGLEKGRVEVTRTLKKVSVLQAPTLPEESLQPRRLYNIVTFVLVTMLVAGILTLLAAIIRDHKD